MQNKMHVPLPKSYVGWNKSELRKACHSRSISTEGNKQQLVEKLKSWAKRGGILGFITQPTPHTPSKCRRTSSNDEPNTGTPSKRKPSPLETGKPPNTAHESAQEFKRTGMNQELAGKLPEIHREATKFQGGQQGENRGNSQAQERKFKANNDGGGSPGEDTGQGGVPDEGGGRKLKKSEKI